MWLKVTKFLCIVGASSVPFLFSLNGDFVFDDSEAITRNKDITCECWVNAFYHDFWGTNIKSNFSHKSYRPLTTLTFRLNYYLNGNHLSATQFKVTNLICHVICSVIVWLTFNSILKTLKYKYRRKMLQTDLSFLGALLFSVHPIHVEAVSGIVGRADVLAASTFFLAIINYNKAMTNTRLTYLYLLLVVILATISMFFKENGITVLGFCITYELVVNFKMSRKKLIDKLNHSSLETKSVIRICCIILAIVVALYGRWIIMGGMKPEFKPTDNPAAFSTNLATKIQTYSYVYFLNSLLLIWPQWLCYDWSMGCVPLVETLFDYRIVFILIMYCYGILLIRSVLYGKETASYKRLLVSAVLLIVIPFLPAANIFYPVGFVVAERILYISSAGYCLLITIGLSKIIELRKGRFRKLVLLLYSILIGFYGSRSWQRSFDWQTEHNLFLSGLSVCPLNAKVHYNVAKIADARNHTVWALAEYREAIKLYPEYIQAMNNLANLLKSQKQFSEAEHYLRTAIRHKRNFPAAWMNLGIVLASTKRYDESQDAYKTALEYRSNYPDCLYNLGNLYLDMNKSKEAVENWLQAINLKSTHVLAWTNLLALLDNTGQLEKALEVIPKALKEVPDHPSINFAIANIYGKMELYEDAESFFLRAIKLFGDKVQAIHYANLGVLYHRWKRYDFAKEMYQKSLLIDPTFKSAKKYLNTLK